MKKIFAFLAAVLVSFHAASVPAVDKKNPYMMIEQVADVTFKRLANENAAIRQDPNLLKDVVRQELMPYIDYRYAAAKVLGKNYRKVKKEDFLLFVPVFRDYLVTSYAQVFTLYDNQAVAFEPSRDTKGKKVVSVKTVITEPGRDPIDISFKVRRNKKTNEWKAFDMVAEGVSLLDAKQAELSSIIRQKGLPHVTAMLKEKANRNITFKEL